jgi:hypothetical protein
MATRRALALGLVLAACGGQVFGGLDGGTDGSAPGSDGGGTPCGANQGCPTGQVCGYATSEGCSATTGQCFLTGALCNAFSPGCSCAGLVINIACNGLPPGYTPAPLAHAGLCDAGVDSD